MTPTPAPFGVLPDGREVQGYTLESASGVALHVISLGGIITSLVAPDRAGHRADLVLGYDTIDGYLDTRTPYFGAIVGRYGNRIAGAAFSIDGERYPLAANNGPNALHGGIVGFDKVLWNAEPFTDGDAVGVILRHVSPDGDEGYPGKLRTEVTYRLDGAGALTIDYRATTDRPTVVNLTQHSYFNLAGHATGSVLDHELTLHASRYTPVDTTLIPTGELAAVDGTPFDFRSATPIGRRIGDDHPQLAIGGGYDHNYVIDRESDGTLQPAAFVHEPVSGRTLSVSTTEPGIQLYTSNFLDGALVGKGGVRYHRNAALCLETQHFPDSPNQPHFPTTLLRPGEEYRSRTRYEFSVNS